MVTTDLIVDSYCKTSEQRPKLRLKSISVVRQGPIQYFLYDFALSLILLAIIIMGLNAKKSGYFIFKNEELCFTKFVQIP